MSRLWGTFIPTSLINGPDEEAFGCHLVVAQPFVESMGRSPGGAAEEDDDASAMTLEPNTRSGKDLMGRWRATIGRRGSPAESAGAPVAAGLSGGVPATPRGHRHRS